jgi:small subunit ribosomal protein S20
MPQHKSAAKRMRTADKARTRNRAVKSHVKKAIKEFADAPANEEQDEALRRAVAELDRAARKGILPTSRVDRKKSRLARERNRRAQAAD